MVNIQTPSINGRTDAEKIDQIARYLQYLAQIVEMNLSSISVDDLSPELRGKIDKILTEHQDLSHFASKSFAKKLIDATLGG